MENNNSNTSEKKKRPYFNRHKANRNKKKSEILENEVKQELNDIKNISASEATIKPEDNKSNGEFKPHGNKKNRHKQKNKEQAQKSTAAPLGKQDAANSAYEPILTDALFDDDLGYFSTNDSKKAHQKYTFTQEELDAVLAEKNDTDNDDRPKTEIVGIRFKKVGKMYYFSPNGLTASAGEFAVVETARGMEFGQICLGNHMVPTENIVQPLRPVMRIATKEDIAHNEENSRKEIEAFRICLEKIDDHGLDMKLVDAQYTFDDSKLIFYFTSSGRVDFRELVKDLASVFRIRIELRQIGIRDEAKLMGGLGVCGRPLCCASFLSDFVQVSIKMAKEQGLSLNSAKISGACGRLMCCLRYEYDTYQAELAITPPVDSVVEAPDGKGIVTEINPLSGTVKVRFTEKQDIQTKTYKRELLKIISMPVINEEKEDNI